MMVKPNYSSVLAVLTTGAALVTSLLVLVLAVEPAEAAFPGENGRIAFNRSGNDSNDIYVTDPDGTGIRQLTNEPGYDFAPAFSPDGTKLAFTSYRDGNGEIYVMNADGSAQTNLTNNPADDLLPAFSPDGNKIAFERLTYIWYDDISGVP